MYLLLIFFLLDLFINTFQQQPHMNLELKCVIEVSYTFGVELLPINFIVNQITFWKNLSVIKWLNKFHGNPLLIWTNLIVQDRVRTDTYRTAIMQHQNSIAGKVIQLISPVELHKNCIAATF